MSRRREALSWGLIGFVLLLVAASGLFAMWPQLQPHTDLHLGDGVFTARVAKTQPEREKGLSGTANLGDGQAMILVFDRDDKWPITMKDMNYPIDIVWLDKDKKVVFIVKNAPPESYPYETFTPRQEARYVVELPAGTVGRKSINTNSVATFDEHNLKGLKL